MVGTSCYSAENFLTSQDVLLHKNKALKIDFAMVAAQFEYFLSFLVRPAKLEQSGNPGQLGYLPITPKYPNESFPQFHGNMDTFLVWVKEFGDYSSLHSFPPAICNKIDVDMKFPFKAAREKGITVTHLRQVMVARWDLLKSSKEPKSSIIHDKEGVPRRVWAAIHEIFRLESATRTSILARKLRSPGCETAENLCDVLFRMDAINRQLRVRPSEMGEESLQTTFLEERPSEQNSTRNLTMDSLLCERGSRVFWQIANISFQMFRIGRIRMLKS